MPLTGEQVQGIIRSHQKKQEHDRSMWDRYRSWYLSEYWKNEKETPQGSGDLDDGDDEEVNLETNYPYAYIDTMISNVCPTNPQITVVARRPKLRESARFREALVNDSFKRAKLHDHMWSVATDASLCGRGFIKTVWSIAKERAEYFVVDPRHVFFDLCASRWEDIRYLIETTVLTEEEFKQRAKRKRDGSGAHYRPAVADMAQPSGYPRWLQDRTREGSAINKSTKDFYKWITVFEVYDFQGEGRYYHVLEGVDEPLFEDALPYENVRNPFSILTYNDNKTDLGGLSDVRLIEGPQARLNEIDTLELWHAHASIPVTLVNSALVDSPEDFMEMLRNANQPGMIAWLHGKNNAPLSDIIGQTPVPQIDPSFQRMRERTTQIIEFILGIPQYSRGVVGVADVATEVALADTATRTRNGRRIKRMNDLQGELGDKTVGLYEEFLPADTDLALRLIGSREVLLANRETLGMGQTPHDDRSFDYDYDAIPFSPTENNRILQLKNLEKYMQVLMQSQAVDQEKLMAKLLELLQLQDILKTHEPPAAGPLVPTTPGPGSDLAGGLPGTDNLATGALPEGTDVPISPTGQGGPGGPGVAMPTTGPRPQVPR